MRYLTGFGLVGLLVVCGIYAVFFNKVEYPMLKSGLQARQQAEDISGKTFMEAIKVSPQSKDDRDWLDVTWLDPAGPPSTFYGLVVGDKIIAFGDVSVQSIGADPAAGMFMNAYRSPTDKQTLTVIRGAQTLTLPLGAGPAPSTATPPASGSNPLPPLQKIPLH